MSSCRTTQFIFQYLPRWRNFINKFYLNSLHRRKAISGTLIKKSKYDNSDFIAISFLAGGSESHSQENHPVLFIDMSMSHNNKKRTAVNGPIPACAVKKVCRQTGRRQADNGGGGWGGGS